MNNTSNNEKQIQLVTIWGMITTIFLAIVKLTIGVIINSIALIADGIHSISDLLTDITVLISNKAARKPPDLDHQYGHGKFETFGAQIIAIILILVGVGIGWKAINLIYNHQQNFPGPSLIAVSIISVISKEILFQYTKKIAIKTHSTSLFANAWHHRSDALSSVGVILGGISSMLV